MFLPIGRLLLAALVVSVVAACNAPSTPTVIPLVNASAPTPDLAEADAPASATELILVPTPTPPPPPDLTAVNLALEEVVGGLDRPLFVTHAGDGSGRLFVVERPGTIRVITDGALLDTPFLDISEQVNDGGSEQGLLGLAFAPDYAQSGIFYVNYTDADGATNVIRFRVPNDADDANIADPATAETILRIDQPARNHNGGMLAFGSDGMLYIGMGDGGGANDTHGNGQNPDSLLGKLLRIDVAAPATPYAVPVDNPWLAVDWGGADVRDEVLASGLRNPWRFSFDRVTGDLWLGDVGQNQYEEVNFVPAPLGEALNFGWPIMEGMHCFQADECPRDGLIVPAAEYEHQGHCSVTGGYVYRGLSFPVLDGVYFYGDYCSGVIWALTRDPAGAWQSTEMLDTDLSISSFGEDEQGELYVTDLAGGTVARIVVSK